MIYDVIDNDDDSKYLSDHCLSMRSASVCCLKLFERFDVGANKDANRIKLRSIFQKILPGVDALRVSLENHRNRRNESYLSFWNSTQQYSSDLDNDSCRSSHTESISHHVEGGSPVKIKTFRMLTVNNDDTRQELADEQVHSFKDRFQNRNVPCLITGLDLSPHFRVVNQKWRNESYSADAKGSSSKIDREWFRDELGDDFLVPLRYIPFREEIDDPGSDLLLDEDGRAMECETKEVPMKAWIDMLETSHKLQGKDYVDLNKNHHSNGNEHDRVDEGRNTALYYLKDWHLQERYSSTVDESTDEQSYVRKYNSDCSLYTVPQLFGHDLLNSFLTRFTKGDYRFCYWGPSLSFTARHSDVMHSFSWSYNVVGTKEWTFYRNGPPGGGSTDDDEINRRDNKFGKDCETFTVIQETGQTIFVPATWQHKVVNLEETISINHNWITSANLDLVWDCLKVEMVAIQKELRGWACDGSDNDDDDGLDQNMEACENMLRGCIGLDVTSFLLMSLVGLLEAIAVLISMPFPNLETLGSDKTNCYEIEGLGGNVRLSVKQEELVFDVIRLASVLQEVTTVESDLIQLRRRISAVLQSNDMAQQVERMVKDLIESIQIN